MNTGETEFNWAAATAPWVTLSKSNGTLIAGSMDWVDASINGIANGFDVGSYSDTITFMNTTNHFGDTSRGVSLTVNSPIPPGMVLIPAGAFQMGDTFSEGNTSERPVHAVYLDAFYIDAHEVTNQEYAAALNWA
jgi:formylglycine-generating enzyme required for sulfatase activity